MLLTLWILRFTYAYVRLRSMTSAYQSLPGFHLSTMWLPGSLAGLLWSIGNIASIVCVSNLGEGVGYCVVQSQMLVGKQWSVGLNSVCIVLLTCHLLSQPVYGVCSTIAKYRASTRSFAGCAALF